LFCGLGSALVWAWLFLGGHLEIKRRYKVDKVTKLLSLFRKEVNSNGAYLYGALEEFIELLVRLSDMKENGQDIYQVYDDTLATLVESSADIIPILRNANDVYKKLVKMEAKQGNVKETQ
jgi:hypothetical protein